MNAITTSAARRAHLSAEPIHAMIYFSPLRADAYGRIGITHNRMAYFASRSAAMGPVPAEIVIATFFNFSPELVRSAIPAAWDLASPDQVLAARLEAADQSLVRAWGDDADGTAVREAADLARRAAERACERLEGRPLFAAHARLPWPDAPHLVLWHAQTLLREYRGDGHIALLLAGGLDGIGALITHAAAGGMAAESLRISRAWSEQDWQDGVTRLRGQGWLGAGDALTLTDAGRERRDSIETRTDELAAHPYEAIGADGCARLAELTAALSAKVMTPELGFPAELTSRYAQAR